MRKILASILKRLTRAILWKHKPSVIGVTGSVGKTSAKEAIFAALNGAWPGKVRRSERNLNTEIGLPIAVLGGREAGRNVAIWALNMLKGLLILVLPLPYPKALVLEMAADKPGDIQHFASFVKLDVAVITAIGSMPVHLEFFQNREAYVREKAYVLDALKDGGTAVLNGDDETVRALAGRLRDSQQAVFYGTRNGNDVLVSDICYKTDEESAADVGMRYTLSHGGAAVPFHSRGTLGRGAALAAAAAAAAGGVYGIGLARTANALTSATPLPGRMRVLDGIKDTLLIDDSYNSSPLAAEASLAALLKFSSRRRVAVLGDMLELGANAEKAHRELAAHAADAAHLIFLVGDDVAFTEEELMRRGFEREKNIWRFVSADDAAAVVHREIKDGDVVLVKGSQFIRTEKVVKEIIADSSRAKELLVRQEKKWLIN